MKDYYKILKVERSANGMAIKKAYRALALTMHPDRNNSTDAHGEFILLNEAYQVLSDHNRRMQYDQLYDYQILNKEPRNKSRYNRKHNAWESNVNESAKKGRARGEKHADESVSKFKRIFKNWGFEMALQVLLESLWFILRAIISIF